mgnify:CR=1 FL=1
MRKIKNTFLWFIGTPSGFCVCLTRATVTLPRILIVDEPTAALDFENSNLYCLV